jgi:hypothetical protein
MSCAGFCWSVRLTARCPVTRNPPYPVVSTSAIHRPTMDWHEFEAEVRRLLELQGWRVSQEQVVGHKKVDGLIEKPDEFGRIRRMALECKCYTEQMRRDFVSGIYADYLPLIQKDLIDGILLVSTEGLAPSAKTYCDSAAGMTHITYVELMNALMDFRGYVRGLMLQYGLDHLDQLYVEQGYDRSDGAQRHTLEHDIRQWIELPETKPFAILASYGMGKTTFARRLAYMQGVEYTQSPRARIPILIKLEEIASDQSLEGLLGRHLTSTAIIPNYNFQLFMHLNALGRFLLILDGFDEMKRAMSWESMRYNFHQLNRLVMPRSKVVLLGRPTIFLNEQERAELIHGQLTSGNRTRKIPGAPDYTELHLLPFTPDQIVRFIENYALLLPDREIVQHLLGEASDGLGRELKSPLLVDLGHRPVQLKMLVEVLPDYEGSIDSLTTVLLYSEFIDLIIRRESEKQTRDVYTHAERRQFASELAYWMWAEHLSAVRLDQIPDSLFVPYRRERGGELPSLDVVKRDLLGACFLDRKEPEGYFFPHRSYQEYLVAERLHRMINGREVLSMEVGYLTPELVNFLLEMFSQREAERWHRLLMSELPKLSPDYVALFATTCQRFGIPISRRELGRLSARNEGRWIPYPESKSTPKSPHRISGVTPKKKYRRRHRRDNDE